MAIRIKYEDLDFLVVLVLSKFATDKQSREGNMPFFVFISVISYQSMARCNCLKKKKAEGRRKSLQN